MPTTWGGSQKKFKVHQIATLVFSYDATLFLTALRFGLEEMPTGGRPKTNNLMSENPIQFHSNKFSHRPKLR